MPHFDYTITLGTIIQLVGFVGFAWATWTAFKTRVDLVLKSQADLMVSLTKRFEDHEHGDAKNFHEIQGHITKIVGELGRAIGRIESKL